jgi:sugar phosphate isomerase/epimerase
MGLMAGACQSSFAAAPAGDKARIALQLYTMRDPAKEDLPGTLRKIREMGWEYVQWSGMPNLPAEKIREELDKAGLKAIAAHVGVESFETDFDGQVKFWKTVGVEFVGPGGMMGDCKESLEAWLRGAKRLDTLGEKLRKAGMRLTYHNHASEFEKFDGDPRCKEDILMEATSPKNLCAELDTAWVYAGEADPAAYIRKFKGRCPTIHAKDYAPETKERDHIFVPLGKGILNWQDIFAAGRESGVEWYIYEQDRCDEGPFVAAKESYEYLVKNLH